MTARPQDVALLPLPWCLTNLRADDQRLVFDYTRACVEANVTAALASAQAREEELRAEVERLWQANIGYAGNEAVLIGRVGAAEARAERLAEALRAMVDEKVDYMLRNNLGNPYAEHTTKQAVAALSTNAATQTGETNEAAE